MRTAKDGRGASHFRPLNRIPVFAIRSKRRDDTRLNKFAARSRPTVSERIPASICSIPPGLDISIFPARLSYTLTHRRL
jgi:hypothetical protein